MKNWKTTLVGILTASGTALQASENPTVKIIGQIIGVVGLILLGVVAKDFNVSGQTPPQQ